MVDAFVAGAAGGITSGIMVATTSDPTPAFLPAVAVTAYRR
ncbi:hypothetical protein ACFUJY_30290 [Streptomyces sp. NPDC057249]